MRRLAVAIGSVGLALGLVPACGEQATSSGAGGDGPVARGTSAATGAPASPTHTAPAATVPSEAAPSGLPSDRPAFPADLKVLYQPREDAPGGGQAGGAEAVADFGRFWRAWWYAVATGGRDTGYRSYLAGGSVLGGTGVFTEVVEGWARKGERPTGTIRAYGIRVLPVAAGEGRVFLVGCGDESGAGAKNVNTGQVTWSFGKRKTSRYKIRVVLARTGGSWRIHEYQPVSVTEPAGRECRG